jgi:NAD(P)-dependent dehydrogenase (short-subunit alcohol dehydrogenase family)
MKRTVLVTGANRGIGLAVARQLAEPANRVFLGSRDPKAGEEAATPLRRGGLDVSPIRLDLADAATIDAAVEDIERSGHSVDVLVNNAGVLHEKPLLELTDEEIADPVSVHVTGPIRLVRAVVPNMAARG